MEYLHEAIVFFFGVFCTAGAIYMFKYFEEF